MAYGWTMLRMIAVLAGVCGLAYVLLRWGLKRFAPIDPSRSGRLEVVERLAVGPKQALMVVRVDESYWLVGLSEQGFEALGQLEDGDWDGEDGDLETAEE